jgi:branched-chain amino acid transport system permease protein
VSDVLDRMAAPRTTAGSARPTPRTRRRIAYLALAVALLVAPFYVDAFWLQVGLFGMAAVVAALGLGLLLGHTGQLSLGHAFFVAVGAYGYTALAAEPQPGLLGLSLPPLVAAALAVLLSGAAGLAFSPIAARLRGIYLGIASLGLVFGGQHLLFNAEGLTGGFNGRNVPDFTIGGFSFGDLKGEALFVLGVPFGREEKLWYLSFAVTVAAYLFYRNVTRSRPGRALRAIRDHEVAAEIMGVAVTRYKAYAFALSSMYAGLGGVLLGLAFSRIVPETFGVALSVEYLAMVVIGGFTSAGGLILGALFVSSLPTVLERYAHHLPGLSTGGITPSVAAKFVYGAAIVLVLLIKPRIKRSRS